jgi:hypothetical protein
MHSKYIIIGVKQKQLDEKLKKSEFFILCRHNRCDTNTRS